MNKFNAHASAWFTFMAVLALATAVIADIFGNLERAIYNVLLAILFILWTIALKEKA